MNTEQQTTQNKQHRYTQDNTDIILIDFLVLQLLHEQASMLRNTYIDCLVITYYIYEILGFRQQKVHSQKHVICRLYIINAFSYVTLWAKL
jgi:hypothetical protein